MTEQPNLSKPHLLSKDDKVGSFDCGSSDLNNFIKTLAKQNQREDYARIWVVTDLDTRKVVAFYAIANGSIDPSQATLPTGGISPPTELPVFILARLAVHKNFQGKGIGKNLLADAIAKCKSANQYTAGKAITLQVLKNNDKAIRLYESFDFTTFRSDTRDGSEYLGMLFCLMD